MTEVAALEEALRAALAALPAPQQDAQRIVACSGGRDSLLLLHLLARLQAARGDAPPAVLHVHHGLDPAADRWAESVRRASAALGASCSVRHVAVREAGGGLEEAARKARHAAFEAALDRPAVLLLAHHADDQAETHLLRLLRGAGPGGLAAMTACRPLAAGVVLRPWLAQPGQRLEAAAQALSLRWHEDPDNRGLRSDRVFLRRQLLPQLEARWPGARGALGRSATAAADDAAALEELLARGLASRLPADGDPLPTSVLAGSPALQRAVLRGWLAQAGRRPPGARRLEALRELASAAPDAQPIVELEGAEVRRHDDHLFLLRSPLPAPRPCDVPARDREIDVGTGCLTLSAGTQPGLAADGTALAIRYARGGERIALPGRPNRPLRRLLQEARVPPWWRSRTPLLYRDAQLVAVAGVGIAEDAVSTAPGALSVRWAPVDLRPGSVEEK